MSVITRILTPFLRAAGHFTGRVVSGVSKGFLPGGDVEMLWQRLGLTVSQDRVTRPYGQNAWVHSAISAKATNIAGVPLRIFMGRRGTEQKQPVADTDPWVTLLTRPGPLYRNWPSFIGAVSAYLDLYGEAPMLALGPEWKWTPGTVPDELYLASPSRLEPEIDRETQILLGWWITDASGLRHQVSAAQLGMIASFNPDSPIRGMSPLVAAALGMDFDYSAHNFNVALMRNGADPGGLVKIPGAKNWTKEQTEAMRLQWEDRHKGSSKGGRVAVVDKEIDYLPTTTTHKGMQFSESRQWSRDEVKAVLKVTDLELGDFAGQTFANAAESRRWLWEQSLVPRMRAIEPPPAPTLRASTVARGTGTPSTKDSVVTGSAPSITAASVDVPPMSNGTMGPRPVASAWARAPRAPPAGPLAMVATGRSATSRGEARPAFERRQPSGASRPWASRAT